jgi:aspartate-semialdehyde dehydrogenase
MERVAVIGASGAVGREIVRILQERKFPLKQLRCFTSSRSVGGSILFQDQQIPFESLTKEALRQIDLAFFAAGSTISKEWIPQVGNALCIDSSSAFRKTAPLIIPEINADAMKLHTGLICSPNCVATVLLMPLAPLHRHFKTKRIVMSTYQAASGAGASLVKHLQAETLAHLNGISIPSPLPFPYAFNLYPHDSELADSGYVDEESKILDETRKILEDESIQLSATCVRVPVLRAHSISVNVEFHNPFTLAQATDLIKLMPGVKFFEDREKNRFATPHDASHRDEIYVGRLRIDPSQPNTLEFWAVGDQLLKGAALNAVQIAETAIKRSTLPTSRDISVDLV